MKSIPTELLRQLIREVVQDCLDTLGGEQSIAVRVSNDDDLNLFVGRVLQMADDPATRDRLRNGQITFTLDADSGDRTMVPASVEAIADSGSPTVTEASAPDTTYRFENGPLTEKRVNEVAAAGHASIILGRRAIATPLGRERARALKISVSKERT